MRDWLDRLPSTPTLVRLGLVVFVLAWIFGPYELRTAIPIWLPFLIALGLELNFLVSALREAPAEQPDRGPQSEDRERFGYGDDAQELILVRDGAGELWVPYSGETPEEFEETIEQAREAPEDTEVALDQPEEPEHEPRGLPLRRFVVGLAVIGALAALFWVVESRSGWNGIDASTRAAAATRFSEEASRVAGKQVDIRCDEAGDYVGAVQHADGVAVVGGNLAYLTPERCLDLYRLAFEDEVRSNRTGRAVAVLAHEAWHLRGESNEGITECYALQSGVDLGRRLGLSEETAQRLMRQQLAENALRGRSAPAYRVPPDCRDGGRLDLKPNTTRFP